MSREGELLYEVVRYKPKSFRQRRPDGQGGWTWALGDTPRVLYRLPELLADRSPWVYVVEGEKDADNLRAAGLPATTNAGGAGKWGTLSDDSALEGRRVCVIPDADKPGRGGAPGPGEKHAQQVAQALQGRAQEIRILRLPGGAKDASDWLETYECAEPEAIREALAQLTARAEVWRPSPRAGSVTVGDTVARLRADTGNAARFVRQHGENVRYCASRGTWHLWNGQRWEVDERLDVHRLAKETALNIFDEAKAAQDGDERNSLGAWALKSQRADRLNAMMNLARCELSVHPTEFDRDPWLLNVMNGTVDLQTGELRPHRREDLLSRLAPVSYDPAAEAPRWQLFLDRIFAGNADLIGFVQRLIGHSLTGDCREQYLFIFHGDGANGKGVLLETVSGLLGDYATEAPPDLLIDTRGEQHPTEIADLCGRRLVVASENEEGARLKMQLVKRLTGDARLKGRFMRQDFFEFARTHKLLMATNNRPIVREQTHAVWRRLRLVPFGVTIPEAEQDKQLTARLEAEWPGVLAWAVRGCLAWLGAGLGTPEAVTRATEEYEAESDPLLEFLEADCRFDAEARVSRAGLWEAYQRWADGAKLRRPLGRNMFFQRIRRRPEVSEAAEQFAGKVQRMFRGVGLQVEVGEGLDDGPRQREAF